MRWWIAVAAALLSNAVTPAFALDCTKASVDAERAICRDPVLKRADLGLTALYIKVRAMAFGSVRTALTRQQRDWLRQRDSRCKTSSSQCLAAYMQRRDQLTALYTTGQAYDKLSSVYPVIFRGSWRVVGIKDMTGRPPPVDLPGAVASNTLPPPGTIIQAGPDKLCLTLDPCQPVGWTATTLGKTEGGERIAHDLKLNPSLRTYEGTDGAKWSYHFTIVKQSDHTLLAVFGYCEDKGQDCRNAYEIWEAASPDARVDEGIAIR